MEIRYRMIKSHIKDEQGTVHITYGIEAYYSIADISTDRQAVSDLVEECNRLSLSSIHLSDVVEDFITLEAYL